MMTSEHPPPPPSSQTTAANVVGSPSGQLGSNKHLKFSGINNNNFVIVELHRDDLSVPSFGFNIKGGAEHGCPVYIWRVEPGSLADRSGLKSGDEIVQANGVSFQGISHADALKVLKGQTTVTLYIKAPSTGTTRRSTPSHHQEAPTGGTTPIMGHHPPAGPIPLPPPLPQPQQHGPPPPPPVHHQSHHNHHRVEYYTWVDRHGNPVPPPTEYTTNRLINLEISPGQNLGLMIRGGSEYGLGIYVTGVDPGSVAERVGLQRGDEILSVNGKNFTSITHDKAVQILKSSKRMQIVASYIGKIPADLHDGEDLLKLEGSLEEEVDELVERVVVGGEDLERDGELDLDFVRDKNEGDGTGRCTTSILQMIEEKARTVLNKSEHSRFTFYRIEYMQGFLPVVAFVRILLELLNTHEKYTLLTEVRELIRPPDLPQFDELIYTKSSFRVSSAPTSTPSTTIITTSSPYTAVTTETNATAPPPLPPPLPNYLPQHGMREIGPPPDEIIMDDFIENPSGNINEGAFWPGAPGIPTQGNIPLTQPVPITPQIDNSGFATCVARDGGAVVDRQLLITHDPAALTMSHPQILNVHNTSTLTTTTATTPSRTGTVANTTVTPSKLANHVVPTSTSPNTNVQSSSSVPAVRFKVRINKVKPILGIAIEGGSNTPHRLPRIIDVNPDGSAFHSNLRAGQVLLTVDGKKLDGLTHEEIARLILDCYVDMTKSQIEFLVVEAKQNYYYFNSQGNI